MILCNCKLFIEGRFHAYDIRVEDGRIAEIGENLPGEPREDLGGKFVFPGFIDTHVHGYHGASCGDSPESMREICAALPRFGVTSFTPTPLADGSEASLGRLANIRKAIGCPGADNLGMFLYTPYKNRSIAYYPASPELTVEHTQMITGGTMRGVRSILVAPELDPTRAWLNWLKAENVMPVIGFTEGLPADVTAAVERGARLTDHFPNGFPPIDHHAPQAVVQCLLEDALYLQLNADGIHVSPTFMRMMLSVKGEDKIVAVSDSSSLLGYPDGEYRHGKSRVILKDGAVRTPEGKLVTGAHTYDENMRTLLREGFELTTIGKICSENAAKALGLDDRGSLKPGKRADLTVMSAELYVQATMIAGEWFYRAQ